jgi:hypothetical protein
MKTAPAVPPRCRGGGRRPGSGPGPAAGAVAVTGAGYDQMVLPGGTLIGYHRKVPGSLLGGANRPHQFE